MPLPAGGAAVGLSLWGSEDAGCADRLEALWGVLLGVGVSWLAVAPAEPEETVTSDRICSICACATPAFFKSSTAEYGRLETIFFTVAGPTPGNESSSFSDAVFRSILPETVCCCVWGEVLLSFSLSLRLPLGIAPAVTPNASAIKSTSNRNGTLVIDII